MIVLGIETSCDETAVAIATDRRELLADLILSQMDDHKPYGGIVPEVAARAHLAHLPDLVRRALNEAKAKSGIDLGDIDGIAATGGPGLIGGVMVGVMMAKAMAAARGKPFLAINHLEAHALSARLVEDLPFPYLLLLVSGGHCQLLAVDGVGRYRRWGTTIDDAVGEAFDKAAKMLGLGYPGGPRIERLAAQGDPARFDLPRPMMGRPGCDFSFSGLKTALRHALAKLGSDADAARADLAASFQAATADALTDRTRRAMTRFVDTYGRPATLVVAGGVAANAHLRARLQAAAAANGFRFLAPPARLCTDNAAMVAWAGIERLGLGLIDNLDFAPRPRWPLDPDAPPAIGAGV
jgi:N6-L-threonylcarbamoyladenine synthase